MIREFQHLSQAADRASALMAKYDWLHVDIRVRTHGIDIVISDVTYPYDIRPHLASLMLYEKLEGVDHNPLVHALELMVATMIKKDHTRETRTDGQAQRC